MEKMELKPTIENMSDGIRRATIDDISEMIGINIECRKHNYKGIIAQDFLDSVKVEDKVESWMKRFLEVQDVVSYYVKMIDGKIVGFISGGKNMDEKYPYENELNGLYVDIHHQGKSIGKELFEKLLEDDKFKNCKSFYLWTLKENPQSNHFYQKMGGKLFGETLQKMHEMAGVPLAGYVRER